MPKFVNIHTHKEYKNTNIYVKNIDFLKVLPENLPENMFFSVGLHAWDILKFDRENYLSIIAQKLDNKKIVAIGEIGLDKVISIDFSLQKKIFVEQLLLAEKLKIAVVIHSVRAYSDILQILKNEKITTKLIFHDFRANEQIYKQLQKYNSYFSFGKVLFSAKAKIHNYFAKIPIERVFFETDDSDILIEKVYLQAAKLRNIDIENLKQTVEKSFAILNRNANFV